MTTTEIRKELELLRGEILKISWSRRTEDTKRAPELNNLRLRYGKLKSMLDKIENEIEWNLGV